MPAPGAPTRRPLSVTLLALIAVIQAIAGAFWASQWAAIGSELVGRGVFRALLGGLSFVVGAVVVGIALLYVLFAWAAFTGRRWAWLVGFVAVVLNGVGLVMLISAGRPAIDVVTRGVVPVIVFCYLLSPPGRRALKRQ